MARKTTKRTRRTRAKKATEKAVAPTARTPIPANIVGLMRGPTIHEIAPRALLGHGTERMCFLSLG